MLPGLGANSVWTPEKLEGVAVGADGEVYVVTDNNGLDDERSDTCALVMVDTQETLSEY